jgi:hypothetical protein
VRRRTASSNWKKGRVGADPERQRKHCRQREYFVARQDPERVAEILPERFE